MSRPFTAKSAVLLGAVLLLAFGLRLGLVMRHGERPLAGDESSYDEIAWNLVSGTGYAIRGPLTGLHPTAQRGPAYVLYVAALDRAFGRRLVPPLVGQCLMEAASVLLVCRLARRWFGSDAVALGAAALYAVYPPFVQYTAQLITETFTNLAVLATLAAIDLHLERRRLRDLALASLALGLCALNKPQLALLGVVVPFAATSRLGLAGAARAAGWITLLTTLVMSPWLVRNARVFHAFVPGVSTSGMAFWGGAAPVGGRMVGGLGDPWVPARLRDSLERMDELAQSRWMMRDARAVIAADPGRYARLTLRKFAQLWLNLGYDDPPSRASWLLAAFNLGAIALAVVGAQRGRPDPVAARLLPALGVLWCLVYVPFCTVVRYAMPYYAVLFCFTAAGLLSARPAAEGRPA